MRHEECVLGRQQELQQLQHGMLNEVIEATHKWWYCCWDYKSEVCSCIRWEYHTIDNNELEDLMCMDLLSKIWAMDLSTTAIGILQMTIFLHWWNDANNTYSFGIHNWQTFFFFIPIYMNLILLLAYIVMKCALQLFMMVIKCK